MVQTSPGRSHDGPQHHPFRQSATCRSRTRDFDYGVHDEVRNAVDQLRGEIAARIRQAANSNPTATREDRYAYELAAQIAETA